MNKHLLSAFAFVLVSQFFSLSAEAGSCGYTRCWGAVGFGPGGAWGYSHSYRYENQAKRAVQNNCKGTCTVIKSFYNTCGAIAAGSDNGWGWSWAASKKKAQRAAMQYCRQNSYNCSVRAWGCSK
jgi:hypothetical protein